MGDDPAKPDTAIIEPGAFLKAAVEGLAVSNQVDRWQVDVERLPSAPVPRKEPGTLARKLLASIIRGSLTRHQEDATQRRRIVGDGSTANSGSGPEIRYIGRAHEIIVDLIGQRHAVCVMK